MSETTTRVTTDKVRFSYAHVWEPAAIEEGQEKKFSVALIIPKSNKALVAKINKAIEAAKQEGKSKWGGKIPSVLKTPLRDGDAERPEDETYKDSYFINANSTRRPEIVDKNLNPIIDKDEFYSGCFGRASFNLYAFNVSGNKGIACGLGNLQKLADGERLSGGTSAAQDFEAFEDEDDDLM